MQRASAAGNWMVGPPSSWSLRDQEDDLFGSRIVRTLVPLPVSTDPILRSIGRTPIYAWAPVRISSSPTASCSHPADNPAARSHGDAP